MRQLVGIVALVSFFTVQLVMFFSIPYRTISRIDASRIRGSQGDDWATLWPAQCDEFLECKLGEGVECGDPAGDPPTCTGGSFSPSEFSGHYQYCNPLLGDLEDECWFSIPTKVCGRWYTCVYGMNQMDCVQTSTPPPQTVIGSAVCLP